MIPKAKSEIVRNRYETQIETLGNEIQILKSQKKNPLKKLDFKEALDNVMDFVGTPAKYWLNADLDGKYKIHNLIFTFFDTRL